MPGESYSNPSANSRYAGPEAGFAPQPTPPYGDFGHNYGQPAGYDSTPYEANPYQPAFGAVSPYGAAPEATPAQQHPQAGLALILGILGTVLGMTCVVGGLVGIGGIVVGRRVRNEIDAAAWTLHRPLASRRRYCHRHYWSIDLHSGDGIDRARWSSPALRAQTSRRLKVKRG